MSFHRWEHFAAWEREYQKKERVWKGAPPALPFLPPGHKVLELGCGNGKTLSAMQKRPWKIVAVDVSPRAVMLSKMMASTSNAPSNVDFSVADACSLPFQDFSFDAVFAFHVFGHVFQDQRFQMAKEAVRVLRPNGRIFLLGFELKDMRAGKGQEVEDFTFRRGEGLLTHYFSNEEVIDLFKTLRPVSVKTSKRTVKIMGVDHLRSEIKAEFVKE